jgi:hypothetical protein
LLPDFAQKPDIIAGESHNEDQSQDKAKDDGVLLYFAIKVKDQFRDEEESRMRKLFRNDFNNNSKAGTVQKKVKRSVFKMVKNDAGEYRDSSLILNFVSNIDIL